MKFICTIANLVDRQFFAASCKCSFQYPIGMSDRELKGIGLLR